MRFSMKKDVLKKSHISEKSKQVLSFCKIKSLQAHEIGGLVLQEKKNRKKVLTMRVCVLLV